MGTLASMSKDHVFHFRLDEEDRRRLDTLAKHYSAPAATVVRILVKEKFDALEALKPSADEDWHDEHGLMMTCLIQIQEGDKPIERHALDTLDFAQALDVNGCDYPEANWRGGHARVLNDLVRWGYLTRIKGPPSANRYARPAYRPTAKALAEFGPK